MSLVAPAVPGSTWSSGSRSRQALLIAASVLGIAFWTWALRKDLQVQPMFRWLPRLQDLQEHLRDAQVLLAGKDPYELRLHLNDTTPPFTALFYEPWRLLGGSLRGLAYYAANLATMSLALAAALRSVARLRPRPFLELYALSAVLLTPLTFLVLSQAAFAGAWWGQDQVFAMSMIVVDLLLVPPRWRGLLVGIAAGILLSPVLFGLLLLRPQPWAIARTGGAFLSTVLIGAAVNLHASSVYWFHLLPSGEAVRRVTITTVGREGNSSLEAFFARPPFDGHISHQLLWILFGGTVAIVGVFAAWTAQSAGLVVTAVTALALTADCISPVSWNHHWVWAALLPIVAIELWSTHRSAAMVGLALVPIVFLRGYPMVRAIPTLNDVIANLAWSAPSLLTSAWLVVLAASLWRARDSQDPAGEGLLSQR